MLKNGFLNFNMKESCHLRANLSTTNWFGVEVGFTNYAFIAQNRFRTFFGFVNSFEPVCKTNHGDLVIKNYIQYTLQKQKWRKHTRSVSCNSNVKYN